MYDVICDVNIVREKLMLKRPSNLQYKRL